MDHIRYGCRNSWYKHTIHGTQQRCENKRQTNTILEGCTHAAVKSFWLESKEQTHASSEACFISGRKLHVVELLYLIIGELCVRVRSTYLEKTPRSRRSQNAQPPDPREHGDRGQLETICDEPGLMRFRKLSCSCKRRI